MLPYDLSIQYMLSGYTAIFIILAVYLFSLALRWRRLKREQQLLEELEKPEGAQRGEQ